MNPQNPGWDKLVALARRARDDRPETAPYGFATRVAAQAMGGELPSTATLFERWSWRAVAIAGMFAAVSVAANYGEFTVAPDYDISAEDSTIAALLE
jgi:hypothetical protein